MTYFLSDPIPALYPLLVSEVAMGMLQEEMDIQVKGGKDSARQIYI